MSCECVTVSYPSEKLIPKLSRAIASIQKEVDFKKSRLKLREGTNWFKRMFSDPQEVYCLRYAIETLEHRKQNLNEIMCAAQACDSIRISGATLAKIDAWL